jgi:tetratricopeptide (TPR) repeat protein
MVNRICISVILAFVVALVLAPLVPVAEAQKPPAPAPPPVAPPSRSSGTPPLLSSDPMQPTENRVVFLTGRVSTADSSPVPHDVLVERVCNGKTRQQVHASPQAGFSMKLGSKEDSFMDASGDSPSTYGAKNSNSDLGMTPRELMNCELRASASGFRSSVVNLVNLDVKSGSLDVGAITLSRTSKTEGMTLSAIPYKVPPDALRAYQKGLEAERKGKLLDARKYFETAVQIHPKYQSAWFQLGTVLLKAKQKEAARTALIHATTIDTKFLPPYLALATIAYEAEDWTEVLTFTDHILEFDLFNHGEVTGYILDLDPLDCTEAYFYSAVANFKLNNLEAAEKSGLKAEHVDLLTHFPQLHLLLAQISYQKGDYSAAIAETKMYLAVSPRAKDVEHVRAQLAELEKLNASASTGEKLNPN